MQALKSTRQRHLIHTLCKGVAEGQALKTLWKIPCTSRAPPMSSNMASWASLELNGNLNRIVFYKCIIFSGKHIQAFFNCVAILLDFREATSTKTTKIRSKSWIHSLHCLVKMTTKGQVFQSCRQRHSFQCLIEMSPKGQLLQTCSWCSWLPERPDWGIRDATQQQPKIIPLLSHRKH